MRSLDVSELAFEPVAEPPAPAPSVPHSVAAIGPEPFEALNLSELLARPPAVPDWIWRGRLAAGDVALWAGDPGVGKSIVALTVALAVASGGGDVLDEAASAGSVVFLDLENTIDVVVERLRAFGAERDTTALAYVHRPVGLNLVRPDWRRRLNATLAVYRPRLLVVDSLRRGAPALDENDSQAVSTLMGALRDLAAAHGCAIVLVHHPRKPIADGQVDALYAARGSGDLAASVDALLFFRRLKGGLVRIEHAKARRGHPHEPVHYRVVESEAGGPELERIDIERTNADELDEKVLAYVREHPGESTNRVREGVQKRREIVEAALDRLNCYGRVESRSSADLGRTGKGTYWFPSNHAGFDSSASNGTSRDESSETFVLEGDLSDLSRPRRADKSPDEPLDWDCLAAPSPLSPLSNLDTIKKRAREEGATEA